MNGRARKPEVDKKSTKDANGYPRPEKESETAPGPKELLIEGGVGSLIIDLRRMGVVLHAQAFAFRMPDDSLKDEMISAGDVAIVEPCVRALEEGDIVMVALEGLGTLRRVTYRDGIAYFQGSPRDKSTLAPAWEHPFSGIVSAIFRSFFRGRLLNGRKPLAEKPAAKPIAKKGKPAARSRAGDHNRLRDDPPVSQGLYLRNR